jgi:hypothetical protein
MNAYGGPPMTLGNAAAAQVRFMVWWLDCPHSRKWASGFPPTEQIDRYVG